MADAEEVVARLPEMDGVVYSGLALNMRGVERARAAGLKAVDLSIATWDEHSLDNVNMSLDEAIDQADRMVEFATSHGMDVQMGLQTVFGFRSPGDTPMERVLDLVRRFADRDVESISLADTTGMATPAMVAQRVPMVRDAARETPIVLHLHDTRGLGLVNVYEAIRHGIDRFDTSLAGMGGCPFIRGAAGNIATEDTVHLLDSMDIVTGIDLKRVAACSRKVGEYLGKSFPGRLYPIAR
jgi:hydroxymethylglutaryl-CoA lyase